MGDEEIANLSDAQLKTLVIRMLTELVEFGRKLDEKGRKLGLKSTVWTRRKRNIQPEKNEETRIQKNEERLRNLQDIFKHSNI